MVATQVLAADPLQDLYPPAKALGGSAANISTLINPLIFNVLVISGLVAFFVIVIAGFNYITASGDKGKIESAQNMLNYGILGLALVVTAFLITRIIGGVIGFKFF